MQETFSLLIKMKGSCYDFNLGENEKVSSLGFRKRVKRGREVISKVQYSILVQICCSLLYVFFLD